MTPIKQITLTLLAFLFAAVSLHAADRDAELRSAEKAYALPVFIRKLIASTRWNVSI